MSDVIHVTENANLPAARVSALSLTELGTLIGNNLPTVDPLTVGALWNSSGTTKVSLTPLAVADFKNNIYSIGGVSKVLADLFTLNIFTGDASNLAVITGEGFNCNYFGTASASGQLEGTADLFTALTPATGFTAVIDVNVTIGSADENYGDLELVLKDSETGHSASLQILGETGSPPPDGFNIFNNPGAGVYTPLAPYSNGSHRLVISFSPSNLIGAANGGTVVSVAPYAAQATADELNIYLEAILNASMTVEKVSFYPLVTNHAAIQRLSA